MTQDIEPYFLFNIARVASAAPTTVAAAAAIFVALPLRLAFVTAVFTRRFTAALRAPMRRADVAEVERDDERVDAVADFLALVAMVSFSRVRPKHGSVGVTTDVPGMRPRVHCMIRLRSVRSRRQASWRWFAKSRRSGGPLSKTKANS